MANVKYYERLRKKECTASNVICSKATAAFVAYLKRKVSAVIPADEHLALEVQYVHGGQHLGVWPGSNPAAVTPEKSHAPSPTSIGDSWYIYICMYVYPPHCNQVDPERLPL